MSGFWIKSQDEIASAILLFEHRDYNSASNRAYYACFHAAIAVLMEYGITNEKNPHEWVHAHFASELIHRRKRFSASLASLLPTVQRIRHQADYSEESVSKVAAERQLRNVKTFIDAIQQEIER